MKKIFALVVAMLLVAAMMTTAMATNVNKTIHSGKGGSGSITISDANPDQTYGFYKIFDAVPSTDGSGVSYSFPGTKPEAGSTFYTYFTIDDLGNVGIADDGKDPTDETLLSAAAITYLNSNYSTLGSLVYEAKPGHDDITETNNKYNLVVDQLPYGYYYITTTTGTVVSVDTVRPDASTRDKNPGTSIDKEIMDATGTIGDEADDAFAQVGTVVTYEARIPVANGAKNYVFTDTMTSGLTLDPESIKVFVVDTGAATTGATAKTSYGTLTAENKTNDDPDITIEFNDSWITDQVGNDIVVQYQATVNATALTVGTDGNPNTATINWGDTSDFLHDEDENIVYNAKISVLKYDVSTGSREVLPGAGFKLYRLNNTTKEYYKWVPGSNGTAPTIEWVTDDTEATEYFTNGYGQLSTAADGTEVKYFEGLRDGTYYLEESHVPDGFNAITDTDVTIDAGDYTADNLEQIIDVENRKGTQLPSTGGIGTTLFYVGGGILVLAAIILLVTKKRMSSND